MNGKKKITGIENPTKMADTSLQGVVKNQLEIVEVEKASIFTHICSLQFKLTVECHSLTQQT